MKNRRQLRVEELVKRIVGEILGEGAKDPRIGFASVTRVEITSDLQQAKIFVSVYGNQDEVEKTFQGLNSARGYIQRELGSQIRCRYTPIISFHQDKSLSYGARIEELLKEIKEKEEKSKE